MRILKINRNNKKNYIQKKLVSLKELQKGLFTGDYGYNFKNYHDGFIRDIIDEIAEQNTDIYISDLFDWAKTNLHWIREGVECFGVPEGGDIEEQIKNGQFLYIQSELTENLKDIITDYIINFIVNDLSVLKITELEYNEIFENGWELDFEDIDNRLEDIKQIVYDKLTIKNKILSME